MFHIILYPIYGVPFNATTYLSAVCYYALFSTFPVILCCYAYKGITKKKGSTLNKMEKIDDIDKVLSTFKTLAATQAAATENGDYKKGNKAFWQIIQIIKYLNGIGRVNELEALLSDSNVGVRMFAAYGLLQAFPDVAVPILKEIAQREDIHSLTAKATLEEWESNTLIYPSDIIIAKKHRIDMKLTDKRFWIWRILIVLLITAFLIAIVVLSRRAFATDTDTEKIEERKEELFREVFQSYKPVWKYDSLRANTDSINTIYTSAPDSLIYCRQYYEDGQLAAEGWMLEDWSRESDYSDNVGTWRYYTRDGIMIEKQWPFRANR